MSALGGVMRLILLFFKINETVENTSLIVTSKLVQQLYQDYCILSGKPDSFLIRLPYAPFLRFFAQIGPYEVEEVLREQFQPAADTLLVNLNTIKMKQ